MANIEDGAITLIDEIEQGLEPDRIKRLVAKLKDKTKNQNQIFMTTHSNQAIKSCLLSEEAEITIHKSMINQRNKIRKVGRKVEGKCIGTTALTKGLEFDTVVVLDAHNFKDPKNLYVALTRASKKLIVFSKQEILKYN